MIALTTLVLCGSRIRNFLQAYTTSDWSKTQPHRQWGAFLNTQGRVIATCAFELRSEERVLCLLPANNVANLIQHLEPYLVFARVQIMLSDESLTFEWSIEQPTPWVTFDHSGFYTVHDLSLDVIGYVSFAKGCYLGQEIVARVHARSLSHKKRLVLAQVALLESSIIPLYQDGELCLSVLTKDQRVALERYQVWDNAPTE